MYSYLAPRNANVVVQGCESDSFVIEYEVFQGTVLGLPLWNVFFKDIDDTILRCLFRLAKFADDLTAFRNYSSSASSSMIHDDLKDCQAPATTGVSLGVSPSTLPRNISVFCTSFIVPATPFGY